MHEYPRLASSCASFTLGSLKEVEDRIVEELQTSGATRLVVGLQMINLQRAITACGMFSMFEAYLQDFLECVDGFKEANEILTSHGHAQMAGTFRDYQSAINVLKHGRGASYDRLLGKMDELPFKLKTEDNYIEGDVSAISTLIEVNDIFVLQCADIIEHVYEKLRMEKYGY
ncbi:MAG TPA: hypothetical protein VHC40_05745 [Rhizomicrobium sp.]|nr:hypothetical protein [Rhizomicrobium sp.]